jgi:hypothetical protein
VGSVALNAVLAADAYELLDRHPAEALQVVLDYTED